MVIEEKYLENRTTRRAFYCVRIMKKKVKTPRARPYYIEVHWGALGTSGRTTKKKTYKDEMSARFEMQKLVEAKKQRHYHETQKAKKFTPPIEVKRDESKMTKLSKERFLSLEIE